MNDAIQFCPNCSSSLEIEELTLKQCLVCGRQGCSGCMGWRCSSCDQDYFNWREEVVFSFPRDSLPEKLLSLKLEKIQITNGKLEDWINAGGVFKHRTQRRGIFPFHYKEHVFELAGWQYFFSQRRMAKAFEKQVTTLMKSFNGWPPAN